MSTVQTAVCGVGGDPQRNTNPRCLFCGGPEQIEIFEIWDHEFMLTCCCDSLHETVSREMADDPDWARALLRHIGIEDLTGRTLRRLADDGCCGMLLDWQLIIRPVTLPVAQTFVRRHHAHCRPPVTWRFGASIFNGRTMIGVATIGNPVARALCGKGILEVNRLCIRRDVPRALAWNAASMLYGFAVREAGRQGWSKVITYTRADEDGTSLIAAGFAREAVVRGRGWHGGDRQRRNTNSFIDKVRWSRMTRLPKPARRSPGTERTPSLAHPTAEACYMTSEAPPLGL